MVQRHNSPGRLTWCWPLLTMPAALITYLVAAGACYLTLTGWELARIPLKASQLGLFAALLAGAVICVEAMRRFGQPSGTQRDLLSAWWLPIALLLPPMYSLLAPPVIGIVLYLRTRLLPAYRRVLSSIAVGLAGTAASATFRLAVPGTMLATLDDARAWLTRPSVVVAAIGCAVMFAVLNMSIVAVGAQLAGAGAGAGAEGSLPWRARAWDFESLLLDLTETCVGILVTITCALSFGLLLVALPPVILLQRCLTHEQLETAARTDAKTGLLNAIAWQREADEALTRALRSETPLGLLLVDVDHFKQVNDGHGHLTGDEVLRALATELRQQVRESDLVGRFGGEEFTVLLPGTDAEGACRTAERLRRSAARLSVVAGEARIGVTVSIGVAVLGRHGGSLFELLTAADLALYQAKDAGRDQVRLYSAAKDEDTAVQAKRACP
jgi:diguanylate cyclase (GGDEF)-like protein